MLFSLIGGWIVIPVDAVFSHGAEHAEEHVSLFMHGIMIAVPLIGIAISYLIYVSKTLSVERIMALPLAATLHRFWFSGWGMDWLYDALFVKPFLWLARINRADFIDGLYAGIVTLTRSAHQLVARTQTGSLRWYAISVAAGLVLLISLGVML